MLRAACIPIGDGIDYPLRDGAGKYDLTREQLAQKADKRQRTREYKITQDYSGSWLPFYSMGFSVAIRPPCTDEPRIALRQGDVVNVTRWKKYWLYGDKVLKDEDKDGRVRGWFPRKCAVDVVSMKEFEQRKESKKSK